MVVTGFFAQWTFEMPKYQLFIFAVYIPEPNYLVEELRKLPIFHDPTYTVGHQVANEMDTPLVMP